MKFFRMIPLVFAFAAICVGDALGAPDESAPPSPPSIAQSNGLGASMSDESAPPVQSVSPVQSDFRVAQAGPPPSGSELATKDDIYWLWQYSERRWEQSERRWSELRKDLSGFKNTVILLLGGIIGAMVALMAMLFRNYNRGRENGKVASAKMSGAM